MNPYALLVGMETGVATMKNSMKILWKIKNTTTWSSNSTAGYLLKKNENTN